VRDRHLTINSTRKNKKEPDIIIELEKEAIIRNPETYQKNASFGIERINNNDISLTEN
jgi:hypothetical protein